MLVTLCEALFEPDVADDVTLVRVLCGGLGHYNVRTRPAYRPLGTRAVNRWLAEQNVRIQNRVGLILEDGLKAPEYALGGSARETRVMVENRDAPEWPGSLDTGVVRLPLAAAACLVARPIRLLLEYSRSDWSLLTRDGGECNKRERLRALWHSTMGAADRATRGKSLEDFAAVFFGDAFVIAHRNLRTDTEEIDLVLEECSTTDRRFRHGLYLLVECKNWPSGKVDQAAVTKLFGELCLHRLKQGFLLTTGAFTREAVQQARYAGVQGLEIVLIDGSTIVDFLRGTRPVSDLLADLHRRQMLRAG